MSRRWNTGICLMTLLMNGLISTSNRSSSSKDPPTATPKTFTKTDILLTADVNNNRVITGLFRNTVSGISASTIHPNLTCPIGSLHPNETNCGNRICKGDETYDPSFPCFPGYIKEFGDCVDINECTNVSHACGAYSTCKNTVGGYSCNCDKGFQKDDQAGFCPSKEKNENKCADIDECRNSLGTCGSNEICNNTKGSYKCSCENGFINISNTCIVKCKYSWSNESCETFQCKLKSFTDKFTPFCENVTSQPNISVEELLEDLEHLIDGFRNGNKTDRLQNAGLLLKNLESTVQGLALLQQKPMSLVSKKKTTSILLSLGTADSGILSLQGMNSSITLDSKTAAGNTGVSLLGGIEYTNISHLLEEADLLEEISSNQSFQLVSPVISVFLGISNTSSLQRPVSMKLNFTGRVVSRNFTCVSWSVTNNSWSSEGCVMVDRDKNGVTCNCTHLTSFAILMLLHAYESWTLTLITQIGLSISIFCLVLAIITFSFCRSIRGTRNTIHTHLCISLFFGNCIFLLGITAVQNLVLCRIVAGLLHAFYLCSFCWMSLEGLELYRMLVTVFKTHLKKRYLLAVGYGTPAVIVTISAAIYHQGYGTKEYCWLSREKGFIWAFMGPVCVIILVNCGIFVLTVWKLAEKMSSVSPEHGKLKRIRTLTITSLAQLCILGSCWAFGFFMFSSATPFFVYAFTILNTLQGLQIFCLHCLMHKKVRADYKRWLCALAHFKSPIYSEFSNTSNTHTNTKAKTGKESGL